MASAAYARFPVIFEENSGIGPRDASFLTHAAGYRLALTHDGALVLTADGKRIRIHFANANRTTPAGVDRLAAKSNYLVGSDPAQWRIGISNYREVRYAQVYPGIDLLWHGRDGSIEHDFRLAPGADPHRIQLDIRGAAIELNANGDLTAAGIHLGKPRAFQDGREIACRYKLHNQRVSIALGAYDPARPLTIDPVLSFSTFLGGSGTDAANFVALDGAGNIYVAGTTTSADFPVSAGAVQAASAGGNCGNVEAAPCPDIFVSKFAPDGSTLLFSTYLGGMGPNTVAGMAVDKSGDIYLTGMSGYPGFPKLTPLPGFPVETSASFVAKLSSDGSSMLYATQLPLSAQTAGLAVDATGSVYLTGSTLGNLPLANAYQNAIHQPEIFKTTDSAVHWQPLTNVVPGDLVSCLTVDPSNPQTLYFGTWNGLYKSTGGGASWTSLMQGSPPQAPYPSQYLSPSSLVVDPVHPETLYLGTGFNGIYKSADGGVTWSPAGSGVSRFVRRIAIDPSNPSTLYATTDAGLYVSKDSATTWSPTGLMAAPNEAYATHDVVIDPSEPATLYVGTPNGVMKSLDGGATWAAMTNGFTQSLEIDALAIDPVNPQTLYAATTVNFAPYRTTDGGAHWTQGQWPPAGNGMTPYVMDLLIDPLVHITVWAVTDTGLLVSRDAGLTWTPPPTDLPYYDGQLLAAGSDGTVYEANNNFTYDAFVMKLDPSGTRIVYSTYLGGSGADLGQGIAVDSLGRAYVTGLTSSFDFPLAKALQPHPGGYLDASLSALDPSGSQLLWSTYLGGADDDRPSSVALDPAGNVHLAGWTLSTDFPLFHASQPHFSGNPGASLGDAFVTKVKSDGSALIYSTYLGGDANANAVAAGLTGDTYVAGSTGSKDFPVVNAVQSALAGTQSAFVAMWNGQTGALQLASYLGGSASDSANAIAADSSGNAYIAGVTRSPDFPQIYPFQSYYGGAGDAFLAKIAPTSGPSIELAGVANAASYGATVSPGEIFSVFGTALAVTPASAMAPPLPVKLSDVSVNVNGVPAPMFYVSPLQINAQIPFDTASGNAQVQVSSTAGTAVVNAEVAPTAPAIFAVNEQGTGAGAIEHALTGQLVTNANPAASGEAISIYCTGLGTVNPTVATGAASPVPPAQTVLPVQVFIAGASAQVEFSGLAPGFAGLYQVNAQVPVSSPSGEQNLYLTVGGATSNTVTLAIH